MINIGIAEEYRLLQDIPELPFSVVNRYLMKPNISFNIYELIEEAMYYGHWIVPAVYYQK